MFKTILVLSAAMLVLSACMTRPARSAKIDPVCAELRRQDPSMLQFAAQNWHLVPDEAKRHFRSREQFVRKVRACRRV